MSIPSPSRPLLFEVAYVALCSSLTCPGLIHAGNTARQRRAAQRSPSTALALAVPLVAENDRYGVSGGGTGRLWFNKRFLPRRGQQRKSPLQQRRGWRAWALARQRKPAASRRLARPSSLRSLDCSRRNSRSNAANP